MRADRLLAILLLLQHRGRLSATALARELEVSRRTVLRDVEALSSAGVPVYAERGRHGGFALLPGYTTDLTGLTHDEARALLVAGSRSPSDSGTLGMAPELASAMRKVVAALPTPHRDSATRDAGRVLVQGESWWQTQPDDAAQVDADILAEVRRAVFEGRRLRIRYAPRGGDPQWRAIDPIGLVQSRAAWYLLATRDGADRTYRLSRIHEAQVLDEPADRPVDVDLERIWRDRRDRFGAAHTPVTVTARLPARRRSDLAAAASAVWSEVPDRGGRLVMDVEFGDERHAAGVLWSLAPDVEVLAPGSLRAALAERAAATAAAHTG